MEYGIVEILLGIAILFLSAYYYFTRTFDFWKKRNVAYSKPTPMFGSIKDVTLNKMYLGDFLKQEYDKFKDEPMFGIFARTTPILVVKDPEYIKDVLIKDFSYFADRGMRIYEKVEPLSQHLFNLEPTRWRPLRTKLSPVFTSGKLREMFYLLTECADHFEKFLDQHTKKNPVIECREITAKFTTDVIGVCAFGLKMNALDDEDSKFRKIGRKTFSSTKLRSLRFKIREATPWLYKLLGPLMYDYETNNFFINTMKSTMEYRKQNNIKRNDFVDLLMAIKENPDKVGDFDLTDELITAQAFVFFLAGFETSSTTMSNALYELALNQSIQNKLRQEINEVLKNNNGELKYETVKSMPYMHKVFCETLRKYPPVSAIMRSTVKPYTFSGTKVSIPEKMRVWIPAYAIHRDPEIYPDPDTFDPERFDEEKVKQRHPSFYLPFGDGPRNCIGARFANYQSKVGLLTVIKNYKVDVCEQTGIPYVNNPRAFLLSPIDGIKLKFIKIE